MKTQGKKNAPPGLLCGCSFEFGIPFAVGILFFFAAASLAQAQVLRSPVRIAEGPPGQILVSDYQQEAVLAIDKRSLGILWSFPVQGSPLAVDCWSNLIFIGNTATQNVEVYRLKGAPGGPQKTLEFLYNLGRTPAGEPGFIQKPTDMALDRENELVFVLDGKAKNIKVFDFRGNFVEAVPRADAAPLLNPTAIAVDEVRKELLVSDYGDPSGSFKPRTAARIIIYTYGGVYLDQIDGNGPAAEFQFPRPQGLAADGRGHIFMVDAFLSKILVFDRVSHTGLKAVGSFGVGSGQLKLPMDIVIDGKSGDLFVTNTTPGRVEVFRAEGGTL